MSGQLNLDNETLFTHSEDESDFELYDGSINSQFDFDDTPYIPTTTDDDLTPTLPPPVTKISNEEMAEYMGKQLPPEWTVEVGIDTGTSTLTYLVAVMENEYIGEGIKETIAQQMPPCEWDSIAEIVIYSPNQIFLWERTA